MKIRPKRCRSVVPVHRPCVREQHRHLKLWCRSETGSGPGSELCHAEPVNVAGTRPDGRGWADDFDVVRGKGSGGTADGPAPRAVARALPHARVRCHGHGCEGKLSASRSSR